MCTIEITFLTNKASTMWVTGFGIKTNIQVLCSRVKKIICAHIKDDDDTLSYQPQNVWLMFVAT